MKRKLFVISFLLVLFSFLTYADAKVLEGMVLSITGKEVVIATKDGKKEVFYLSPSMKGDKKKTFLRPGCIVLFKVKGKFIKEIKLKRVPQ